MSLAPGARLGRYEVVAPLGAGGMGEVYRARDERLDRDVAVKVVPEEVAADPERLARFEREARALAHIEHPNILTIHDFGEEWPPGGGVRATHFAVTELLTGETLRSRLARERMSWRRAVEVGAAVADGLGAAHGQGIAHRDLKPDNIFLTADNRVKILDFGLATSGVVHGGDTRTGLARGTPTGAGVVLGTVGYMAPEQVQGSAVDTRADIFSLGCVLFEMVTGRRAFAGATATETLAAILSAPAPAMTAGGSDVPPDLEHIVARCLEKQPGARFQSATDLAFALRALLTSPVGIPAGSHASVGGPTPAASRRPRTLLWAWSAAALVVMAAAAAYFWLPRRSEPSPVPRFANPAQLTTAVGTERGPAWSPDGRIAAYESDEAGSWDIWVSQVGSREAVNRTADSAAADLMPRWSPDGQWIAFLSLREGVGYYVVAAVGGAARKIASVPSAMRDPGAPAWSPDSKDLAYPLGQRTGPWIEILTLASGATRKLVVPQFPRNNVIWDLSWSPDGRWLAYGRGLSEASSTFEIWVTRVSDGVSAQLTDGKTWDVTPSWSADSSGIYFVRNRAGTSDLWYQAIAGDGRPAGPAEQVTTGIGMAGAAVSPDGRRLAYSKGSATSKVFRIPLLVDKPATWSDVEQVMAEEAQIDHVDISRDGRLVVSANPAGNFDLFLLQAGGRAGQPTAADPTQDNGPRWKPDGSEIAFYSQRTGKREIWVTPTGGGPARQVTHGDADNYYPAWSPDGRDIAFAKYAAGIFVMPEAGGHERAVTTDPVDIFPDYSPDGRWIAFTSARGGPYPRLWRVPSAGGPVEQLTDGPAWYFRWSSDKRIVFNGTGERANSIWLRSLDSKQERPITALTGRRGRIGSWGLATDGRFVYFVWVEGRGDIWVADLIQPSVR
jgi:eukaryotic-like serine/threonine-protein kinase